MKKRKNNVYEVEMEINMIDFHTHILPMIDDGSSSVEETLNIIKEAKKVGFDKIILTPHYMENIYNAKKKEIEEYIGKLNELLQEKQIGIKLYSGNEIYITDNIVKLLQNNIVSSLNNTRYVLFELPFNSKPFNLYNVAYELIENNYIPILAHPERYNFVQQNLSMVYELVQSGVFVQSNYGSIIEMYGKKAAIIVKILLKNNMVHFLGTDVHKSNTIYPKIPKILKEVEKIIGKEKLDKISNINPQLVLKNEDIEVMDVKKIKLSFKEKLMLK